MITKADLDWWRNLMVELDWVFATTYAEGAPHEYVIPDKTLGSSKEDCVRAARGIRTFGEPGKFYEATNIYLTLDDGWKNFPLDKDVRDTRIINRGRAELIYGARNHPRTISGAESAHDAYASHWDAEYGMTDDEKSATAALISEVFGPRLLRTLHVGCGTGLPLDLGLVMPVRYVGIDPSTAMLNELVWKHEHLAGVHPMTYAEAEQWRVLCGTQFDTVLALGGSASYLSPAEIYLLRRRAKGAVLLVHYAPGETPGTNDLPSEDSPAAATTAGETQVLIGGFVATVISAKLDGF